MERRETSMLDVKQVKKYFDGAEILKGVDLHAEKGECLVTNNITPLI